MKHLRKKLLVAAIALALVASGAAVTAVASATTPPTTYYACLSSLGGILYNVRTTAAPKCASKDKVVTWGQTGPRGPAGTDGTNGINGSNGTNGTNGNDGADGNTVLNGAGAPTAGLGNDGDFYIDTAGNTLYGPKAGGAWPATGTSLVGPQGTPGANGTDGNTVLNGSGAPTPSLGNDGDFYIDTASNTLYGPKAGGAWSGTGTSLVGPQGAPGSNGTNGTNGTDGSNGNTVLNGTGAPTPSLGNDGDFYIDTANHTLYGPKAGGAWPGTGTSLVGPQGTPGTNGTNGTNGTGATVTTLSVGNTHCANGGAEVTDGSGDVSYACNGTDGGGTGLQAWDSADNDLGTVIGDSEDVVDVETSAGYQVEFEFNGTVGDPDYIYYASSSTCSSGPIWLNDPNDETGDYMNPKQVFWTPQGFAVVTNTSSENPGVGGDFPGAYDAANAPPCQGGFPNQDAWPLTLVSNTTVGLPTSIPTGTITLSTTRP
jgi:hypothetical protein